MELFVFNPEHDYALADGNRHYVPPRSAVRFSYDCAPFLLYSSPEGLVHNLYFEEKGELCDNRALDCNVAEISKVIPWGWDSAVRKHLLDSGVPEHIMPSEREVAKIRDLSHRKTAVKAQEFLKKESRYTQLFPEPAKMLSSPDQVVGFVEGRGHTLLKSPYSGNGRGHLYAHGKCTPTLLRQASGVIARQGSILAENHLRVVQDFAMEFNVSSESVDFVGFSLFRTRGYAYECNTLASDAHIIDILRKYVGIEVLDDVRELVAGFIRAEIAPFYQGNVGVDMFVYEDGGYRLQPFSEANVRRTMGAAAHSIFKNHCNASSQGTFKILRSSKRGELKALVDKEKSLKPLVMNGGKWSSGFVLLNPVEVTTMYAACVELSQL